MQLTIKYFGMIAEATTMPEEQLQIEHCSVSELLEKLKIAHPKLNHMDFKVAVDQQLVQENYTITKEAEIALLPPFAGG
ncbi:MoaD/ThiS family protein [Aquimarina spongiae]|uniref:Molybdopterin synthase sulfur carrier subunit n=1 Tax=Aquimarina spongiae TaxID=570521 RepID=A0A1M6I7Y6_9FLAO|nr:MoaD/ThiS family protein [Aquimarina spongiae]SHJ30570.1 molybdopterin synthase sulfur carrier subunit [Aquimarina spongiae]